MYSRLCVCQPAASTRQLMTLSAPSAMYSQYAYSSRGYTDNICTHTHPKTNMPLAALNQNRHASSHTVKNSVVLHVCECTENRIPAIPSQDKKQTQSHTCTQHPSLILACTRARILPLNRQGGLNLSVRLQAHAPGMKTSEGHESRWRIHSWRLKASISLAEVMKRACEHDRQKGACQEREERMFSGVWRDRGSAAVAINLNRPINLNLTAALHPFTHSCVYITLHCDPDKKLHNANLDVPANSRRALPMSSDTKMYAVWGNSGAWLGHQRHYKGEKTDRVSTKRMRHVLPWIHVGERCGKEENIESLKSLSHICWIPVYGTVRKLFDLILICVPNMNITSYRCGMTLDEKFMTELSLGECAKLTMSV